MKLRVSLVLLLCSALVPVPSFAQMNENQAVAERIDKLEHDIMLLQRQIARGGNAPISSGDISAAGGGAQLEVRLSAIEDDLRSLNGKLEENEFQIKKVSDAMDKLQRDTDFRFNELSGAKAPVPGEQSAVVPGQLGEPTPLIKKPLPGSVPGVPDGTDQAAPADGGQPAAAPQTEFANSGEHYKYAYRLYGQTQYEEAAASFEAFTKKYPKDQLVGNAYFWLGETFYMRRDYVNAADSFRQGFEAMPSGPKAADNLLKLAMSLDALKRDKEACVVLDQIVAKYKANPTTVTEKAAVEHKRIGCPG